MPMERTGVPVAAGGGHSFTGFLVDPMLAPPAMGLNSVSMVGNALRFSTVGL